MFAITVGLVLAMALYVVVMTAVKAYNWRRPEAVRRAMCASLVLPATETPELVVQRHGLLAFSGSAQSLLAKGKGCLNSKAVICGSHAAIGAIGITFRGPVYAMFPRDAMSYREIRQRAKATWPKGRYTQEDLVMAAAMKMPQVVEGAPCYTETFSTVTKVLDVWINTNACTSEMRAAATELARQLKVPLKELS